MIVDLRLIRPILPEFYTSSLVQYYSQVKRSTSSPLSQLKSISKQQNPESLRNLMAAVGKKNANDDVSSGGETDC